MKSNSKQNVRQPLKQELANAIQKAIDGEYHAINYYAKLAELAPGAEEKKIILGIRQDEMGHFQRFNQFYMQLTGHQPQLSQGPTPASYEEGIKFSIRDELEASEFYQKVSYLATDRKISEAFAHASRDEQRHATWYEYLWMNFRFRE